MNETIKTIKKRHSTRKFKDTPINQEVLHQIIECGRIAPSGGNSQTTKFYIIQDKDLLHKLKNLVQDAFSKMEDNENLYQSIRNSIRLSKTGKYDFMYNAPVLIVLTNKVNYGNAMADCVCANHSMMLAATSLNIGNCYINQLHWLDNDKSIRNLLNISDDETICCSLALGLEAIETNKQTKITGNEVVYFK